MRPSICDIHNESILKDLVWTWEEIRNGKLKAQVRLPCWNSYSLTNESQTVLWFGCPSLLLLLANNSNTSENISGKCIFICCHIWSTEYALCLYSDTFMKDKTINGTSLCPGGIHPLIYGLTWTKCESQSAWDSTDHGILLRYQCDFSIFSNVLHFLLKWSTQ